jgi:hypothetical protein
MALIPIDRVVRTLLTWFKIEEPTFNSIIDQFYQGKQINFFEGLRKNFGESNLPALEVGPASDTGEWSFVRVQGDKIELDVHLTISNKVPEFALRLEARLASFVDRILRSPPHVRGRIEGTNIWFQNAFTHGVTYGAANYSYNIRVCKISWQGSLLEYISDIEFPDILQEGGDHFPR